MNSEWQGDSMFIRPQIIDEVFANGPQQGHWTFTDWEAIPDHTDRYEVINGALYVSPTPSTFHQWIVQHLLAYVGLPVEDMKLGYTGFARVSLVMPGCQPVQPDFFYIQLNDNVLLKEYVWGTPDLIVEVLSPETAEYDEQIKFAAYAAAKVPEYGIVDPMKRVLRSYTLNESGEYAQAKVYDSSMTITFQCLPTITLEVAKLFEGAPDPTP